MPKQLNVNLAFQADTSKAKTDIQELQNVLFKLQSTGTSGTKMGLTKELQEAQVAARELSIHLNNAFDANTGKLDLTKFNSSLKASNTNVQELSTKLLQAGAQGQDAFIKLSKSISQASYPMVKINSQLNQLLVTLKNTARWQLSSSLLHGFMGAVSSAYNYVQDLDESLNRIRIVTGQSDEQMAKFASRANEAAKALSTTTTAYTDAALIFYQQGLGDAEVQERTDAVIKMSNVTGDSVEQVSSYMTAIWNNFDDGSESLEHYADVITALGASTASSSAEIAAGLEKFASIGETIGLSYDYATSSLATIVANTRQSAEQVGTGLRTIFSRLQSLQLGETLEDGVDLNKYSKALKTVGVDVLDASGNMREMDNILQDLADKWDLLTEAQKTALAQTVGGVRQYTTLIALMNNWDDMEENLNTARNSNGALQNQADIYADSWEAAKKRVKAAAQEAYEAILNKDLFIDLLNIEEKFISGIGNIINAMGGLKGVITGIGSVILSLIASKIGPAMAQLRENVAIIFTSAQTQVHKFVDQMQRMNINQLNSGNYNDAQKQQIANANQLMLARTKLSIVSKNMTEQEKQMADFALQNLQYDQEKAQGVADTIVKLEEEREALLAQRSEIELTSDATRTYSTVIKDLEVTLEDSRRILQDPDMNNPSDIESAKALYEQAGEAVEAYRVQQEQLIEMNRDVSDTLAEEYPLLSEIAQAYEQNAQTAEQEADAMRISQEVMEQYIGNLRELTDQKTQAASIKAFGGDEQAALSSYQERLKLVVDTMPTITKRSAEVKSALSTAFAAKDLKSFNQAIKTDLIKALEKTKISAKDLIRIFQQLDGKRFKTVAGNADLLAKKQKELKTLQDELNATFNSFNPTHMVTGIERITMSAAAFGQVAMAASALRSAWNALTSEDMSWGERVTTILMSISMLVPSVISAYNSLKTVLAGTTFAQEAYIKALTATTATEATQQAVRQAIITLRNKDLALSEKENAIKTITMALSEKHALALTEEQAATIAEMTASEMANGVSAQEAMQHALVAVGVDAETAAKIAAKFATDALSTSIKAMLGPIGILLAVLTVVITALQAFANHAKEAAKAAAEARKEEAEASQQAADAAKKLNEEQENLYSTYLKCKASTDDSTTAKEQLRTATDELCEALGIEWNALDRLQGKYEKVNQQILEARKGQVQETIDAYDRAIEDNRDIIEDTVDAAIEEYDFGHSTGVNADGSSYDRVYANVDVGMSTGDESLVLDALNDYLEQNYGDIFDREASYNAMHSGEALRFKDDATEEEVLNAIREAFAYIRDNSDELGIDKNYKDESEAYQWLRQLYNASDVADLLAQIAEDEELRDSAVAEMAQINAELAQAQVENGLSIEEITDVDSYNSYKEQYVAELRRLLEESGADMSKYTDDVLNDMADQYLSTYTHLKNIVEDASLEEAIRERLSQNPNNNTADIDRFLEQAENDNTLRVAAQVITDASTTESLQQSMNYIQTKANDMTITAAVEVAGKALKEDGMTQEDWSTIENSGIDWGNQEQGIIEFNEFLAMTYQEQVNYLDNLSNEANQRFSNTLGQQLLNLDEQTEALKARQTELSEAISAVQSGSTEGLRLLEDGFDVDAAIEELTRVESSLSQIETQREQINTEIQFAVTNQEDLEDLNHILLDIIINGEDGATTLDNLDQVIDRTGVAAAKAADIDTDAFETYRDLLEDTYPALEDNAMGANMIALANLRLDKGTKKLCSNWKKYNELMTDSTASVEDLAEIMPDVNDAIQDMLNLSDEEFALLPPDFARKHWDLINDVTNGVEGAIDRLRDAAGEDILLTIDAVVDDGVLNEEIQTLHDRIAEMDGEQFTVGVALDPVANAQFYADCNEIIRAAGMTQEQANAYFANMGYDVEFEEKPADVQSHSQTQEYWVPPTYSSESLSYGVGGTFNAIKMTSPGHWESVSGSEEFVEPPAFAIKTITPNGSYGGGIGQGVSSKPSNSSRTPKTSGGSGGGGGKTEKPKEHNDGEKKNIKDEKERYHVIKNQIEDLSSIYDRISKAKDRAFGSARLANLNKEIDAQKKLNDVNQKYLEEIESYLGVDKATMAGYGAQFDGNGTITNYDALVQQAVKEYNAAVEAFNQAYTDDEGAKEAMEAAEKRYEQFMKDLEQYEETQDLYKDQLQQTIDDANALRDLLLERTQLQVELKVDVAEDSLKLLEQLFDNIENKAYDAAEAFGYLNQMTGSYFDQLNAYNSGLQSLFANQGLSEDDFNKFVNGDTATFNRLVDMLSDGESAGFSAEDVSTIREYIDGLLEANENLREIRQTVHEQILTVWEEWGEKIDTGISKIEHLQAITESYQNIIDIVGQKNLGVSDAFMSRMRQQSIDQANDKLVAEKARYDELRKARDAAYAKFEEQKAKGILSPEEIKTWEDSLAQMDEDVNSASEDFQSAWEDALNGINEAFEAEVQQIVDAYSDAAAGLLSSISELQEAFDRRSDLASQYLEDYEKIYQFNKLNRDIEKSVDETNNVRAKKELLELQSKITALQEAGVDISKYEMEQLRQEYELKKAQIELEEAQDSKSQVQMQRDSDGNYSYVYTANTDDVANAEANYADKLHDMQVSNAEYIQDLQSNMVQMEQDYQDKVQEIMSDTSLSAEERMAKLNEVNQYYDEKMKFYISEAQLWEQNSQRLYEQDWTNYATMTGYKISEEDKWLDHWNETQLSLLTGFDTLEEYQSNHNVNVANLLLESGVAFATWQTNIETAMNNAGTSIGTFEKDATEELQTVAEESDKLKDSIVNMSTDAHQAVRSIVEEVGKWENSYSKTIQNMLTKNTALITSFNQLLAAWSKVETATPNNNSDSGNNGSNSGNDSSNSGNGNNNSGSGNGSGGSNDNSAKAEGVAAAIWMDGGVSGWGNGSSRSAKLAEKGVAAAQAYINAHGPNGDIYRDWVNKRGQLKQYYYGAFDTGGYTGAWGAEGKFAMLHEKELVLNKEDTTNFLQAIDIIRQISDTIDLNALSSSGGLSSLFAATASSSAQTLQQEVTIHAEFPNATDRDEISAAFSDLVNLASQYANRK